MQCRQAPITQIGTNTPPSLTNPGNQVTNVAAPVNLQVVATDADLPPNTLTFSATGLPPGLTISAGGLISGAPTTAGTYPVSLSVSDGTVSTTANLTWTVTNLNPLILNPMPKQPPNVFGSPVTYTASVQNAINPQFKWFFDDGTETGWSSSPTVTHTFTRPSMFWVGVSAKDDRGVEQSYTFSQLVHLPLTAAPPVISGQMAVRSGRLWVVNQDNDTVSVFNTANNQKLAAIEAVNEYCKHVQIEEKHRKKILSMLEQELAVNPNNRYIYIHPRPRDHEMFFGDHFNFSAKFMEKIVRIGFMAAIETLRKYEFET